MTTPKSSDKDYIRSYKMPLKADQVKVVFCGPIDEYGQEPLDTSQVQQELECLVKEYNRTSGKVTYNFKDLRKWKSQGILMLDTKSRSQQNILHFLRHLSLERQNIVFVFVGGDTQYWSTLLSDNSHESNHFYWYRTVSKSNVFKHIDATRKFLNLKAIDWFPV
jgi:uracil DNA glycosylase